MEEIIPAGPAEETAEVSTPEAEAAEPARSDDQARAALTAKLSRIRIAGFKSFAEATTVEVLPGLTGIVGPNGCGKSNVVEALRWAMGETSPKAMRGGEMDDVIFAGTATRSGRNVAEVMLFLEDAAGLAPAPNHDIAELEVTRRISRGEGSNFRVNGKELRARDVQTMFADIGSGARSSALVSQGRVAALIQAKPDDRRGVLEEAAGIAGLRARRHEAELKLRQAETNLSRAEDLLGQLDAQRQGLQRQARQANRYRNISGLVRQAEGEWLALLAARANTALTAAATALAAARSATSAAEQEAEAAAIALHEAEQGLAAPRADEAAARTALERRRVEAEGMEAEESRARAALDAAEARLAELRQDLAHATSLAGDADAARARITEEDATLAEREAGLPTRRDAAAAALAEAIETVREAERAANQATEAAAAGAAQLQAAEAELAAAETRLRRAREAHAALSADRDAAQARAVSDMEKAAASEQVTQAEAAFAAAREALEQAEATRTEAVAKHADARRSAEEASAEAARREAALRAADERHRRIVAQYAALSAERDAALAERIPEAARDAALSSAQLAEATLIESAARLTEAEAARATASEALVQARRQGAEAGAARARIAAEVAALTEVLEARGTASAQPILDQVRVPPGLEAALGAALGEALESPADAAAARHWRNLPPLMVAQPLPDGAVPLSRLVEAPAALARALSQVGLLARGMDGAALQPGLRPGQALVTEEGAVWRWDGHTHHAGAPTPGAVRLAQRNALRAAEARLDQAEVTAAETEAARSAAEAAEAEAANAEAAARNARSAAEAAASAARRAEGELAARDARAESRIAALEPQLARLAEDRAEADAARAEAEALYTARPDIALLREAEQQAATAETEARNAEAAAREARRRAEMALAEARQRQAALLNRASEVENRLAALAPQLERIGAELAEAEAARASAAQTREAAPDPVQLRGSVEGARAHLAEQRGVEASARDAQGALAAEAEAIIARRASLANEAGLWAARAEDASARVADLRRRDTEAEAERDALAAAPEAAALRRAEATRLLEAASEAHAAAAAALAAAERRVSEGSQGRRGADTAFALAREEQVRAQAATEAAETASAAVAARIAERLGEGAELPPAPEELSDIAEDKARRKVERLIRERDEMGPVNLRADLEIAEIEERIGQITHDRDEVMNAIAKLRGSIGHLNREGRERLREVFDRVDTEFRSLFTRLFGGGRAHLALVGSDDPLEAGLEIYAEPPGKKLSTLSLLSGGEQALTALSLIFAVFRCNPAPVCVLDEVDAPLDDANVERLCDLLDAMAAESGTRFLIVTHHPLTMGRMHRLYGVTMQERGVSRLLSVDLGRAIELAETTLL